MRLQYMQLMLTAETLDLAVGLQVRVLTCFALWWKSLQCR
jgi:hypothetical protein